MCGPQQPSEGHKSTARMKMEEQQPQQSIAGVAGKELFTSDEFRVFCFKVRGLFVAVDC